jgi:hypothetical protein
VQIRPIQYNPKTKQLRCYSKIKYRIIFANNERLKSNDIKQESLDIMKNVLSNPDMLMESAKEDTTAPPNRAGSKNYIIVTTNKFLPAVQEFASWKIRMGYSCEIVSQASWTRVHR